MAGLSPDRVTAGAWTGVLAPITLGFLAALFWLAWQVIRLPILVLLVMFEPLVNFALSAFALLIVLTSIFWKFADPTHFPFWTLIGTSLVCMLALTLYQTLIRAVSLGASHH